MYYIKLPPRECEECGYHSSGGAFKKEFGPFYYGKERCPKCKSVKIKNSTKRALPPQPHRI